MLGVNHYGEQQKGYCAGYRKVCYLSDMGVERIYTVLAENEKDARKRFHELLNGEQVELLQIRKVDEER